MRTLTVLLFFVLLGGCSSTPPPKFYSLPGASTAPATVNDGPGLRIGPFSFPDYLRRPNIVTRPATGMIDVAEFERWAGSLENDFLRVLGSRLGAALATGRVSTYPGELRFKPDYVVTGEIVTFDGSLSGEVTLDVHWVIGTAKHDKVLSAQRSVIRESVGGAEYSALVDAHTRAVERLSAEIEAELRRVKPGA